MTGRLRLERLLYTFTQEVASFGRCLLIATAIFQQN